MANVTDFTLIRVLTGAYSYVKPPAPSLKKN